MRFCAFAVLAALPWAASWGQGTEPVTQVIPVASPGPTAAAVSGPAPVASGTEGSQISGVTPVSSGTTPILGGTTPILGGTAPMTNGTAPMLTGTAAMMTGTAAIVSGSTAVTGTAAAIAPPPPSPYSIEIDLGDQRAYLLKDGHKIAESPISSGREGHLTPTGNFEVIQKDLNHFSNLYGKFVDKNSGRVVKSGADAAMPVPKGCKFVPAPMKWFMRFEGAAGMHAGILPGYAASHGCVRMPAAKAELFYNTVDIGTPVHVFGTPPVRVVHEEAEPHRRPAAAAMPPTPYPTPKPRHGWWF